MNNRVRVVMGMVAVMVVGLLEACGPVAAPSTHEVPTATPAATSVASEYMIVLKETGTIAGIDTELRITPSGLATFYDRGELKGTRQMTPTAFQQIQDFLQEVDFFNLQDRYDRGNVSDDKYYALTYTQGGRSKTVTAADVGGQGLTPKRIMDVIAKLTQFEWQMSYKRQP